jgi:hypothetical protein
MSEQPYAFATSTAPADVVRRQYLASATRDLEALRATLAPDVEWTEMAGFPLAGTYRTPTGVTSAVMEKLATDWDDWTAHDDTYVVDGENVVVLARYTATRSAASVGLPLGRRVGAEPGGLAAVDEKVGAGDVRRFRAGQERHGTRDLPGRPGTTHAARVEHRRHVRTGR